jgi:hypothetical protein
MNQQPDLAIGLKRQFAQGPGNLRGDDQIAVALFPSQPFEQPELILFEPFKVSGEIGYGVTSCCGADDPGSCRSASAPGRRQTVFAE